MGSYLNPTTADFQESRNSKIYVDKSLLIRETNNAIGTEQKLICVSRPRRFGKSMAMKMLSAYYSAGKDSHALFDDLKISADENYEKHINRYNVLKINMQEFLSESDDVEQMISRLKRYLLFDLLKTYKNIEYRDRENLNEVLKDIFAETEQQFVILIDEWDCLLREYKEDLESQKKYLDFLRSWLKDQSYVALAYMTGILPVKKYGTHSALNMFTEYSMTDAGELAPYFGFTEPEVEELCGEYGMNFPETRSWYDGYELSCTVPAGLVPADLKGNTPLKAYSMYNPKAVVEAMLRRRFGSYWNRTETYDALKVYIQMNKDGLKDAVVRMLAGESVPVKTGGFENDMTTLNNRDDVLTLLIHLGYLSYNRETQSVRIPNKEVSEVYVTSIERMESWNEVAQAVDTSRKLLEALWNQENETVAAGVDRAHEEISILQYNDENSLSCCIHLAFYFAKEYYNIVRELPSGKGFADVVFVPRPLHMDKPAVVVELKKDRFAAGAIKQIKEKRYCASLKDYHGNLLLCGISYNSKTKKHSCVIEKLRKS